MSSLTFVSVVTAWSNHLFTRNVISDVLFNIFPHYVFLLDRFYSAIPFSTPLCGTWEHHVHISTQGLACNECMKYICTQYLYPLIFWTLFCLIMSLLPPASFYSLNPHNTNLYWTYDVLHIYEMPANEATVEKCRAISEHNKSCSCVSSLWCNKPHWILYCFLI